MTNKPSKNFDQIKPFLRMLEGSIDDARRRRLGDEAPPSPSAAPNASVRNGAPPAPQHAKPNASPHPLKAKPTTPGPATPEPERPLRATPIKPKQSLHPSTGFRPTGS